MGELSPGEVASVINIDCLRELTNAELILLDTICDLTHYFKDKLDVGHILFDSDNAFAHLLLHAA